MIARRTVVVDGYNLLHAVPEYARIAERDLDAARARLVADVETALAEGDRCTIVFDGGGNPASDGAPHRVGGMTVVFSAAGSTADDAVEALAARARERAERVTVVTSDLATRDTVTVGGVEVVSAQTFAERIGEVRARLVADSSAGSRRLSVSSRLPQDTRERLERWAKGERR